jgi:tetratricopeptide (TPR) repeat protein
MFCSECGAKISDEGEFCPECGTPVFDKKSDDQFQPPAFPQNTAAPTEPMNSTPPAMPAFPVPSAPPVEPEKPKKPKKGLFIALGVAFFVIVLAVGSLLAFTFYRASSYDNALELLSSGNNQQAYDAFDKLGDYRDAPEMKDIAQKRLDYEAAVALMDAEDYEGAKAAFEALKSFEDSVYLAQACQDNIDYQAAIADYERGDFESALATFSTLAVNQFSDAADWEDKTFYALASKLYDEGDYYGAFGIFKALGTYEDSADRVKQCTSAYPNTGELYHNGDYISNASSISIAGANTTYAAYFKIYDGSTLVSTIFLNAGASCTIDVPPGDYNIKEAVGNFWFGEEVMFGDEGSYEVLLFDDGNDYLHLEYNIIMTITLSPTDSDSGTSIDDTPTTREDF